ncbi:MAG: hypothetical protein ACK5OA_06595 [Acidovorax sp.]
MSVELSARRRRAAAGAVIVVSLLHAAVSLAQSDNKARPKPAQAGGSLAAKPPAPPPPLRDGDAEDRLLAVYRLISAGQNREALRHAASSALASPKCELALRVVGHLLSARLRPIRQMGDAQEAHPLRNMQVIATLDELRNESRQRVDAQRIRPPANTVPAQFLELSPRSRHAIAVDASRSRLYLFENTPAGLQLVADYYASVGKLGIDKSLEGDQRTPLGVYFITSRLDPTSLKDFYGAGALPIN